MWRIGRLQVERLLHIGRAVFGVVAFLGKGGISPGHVGSQYPAASIGYGDIHAIVNVYSR